MFLFSGAKIRCFLLPRAGFPLKGWGKIPTSLFRGCGVLYIIRCRTGAERKGLREDFRSFLNNQTKYLLPLHSEKNNLMNRLEFKTESKNNKDKINKS
jgi:hypothetical protein